MMEKNVPRLRFPRFEGEWRYLPIKQLISLSSSKFNPEKEDANVTSIELEHLSSGRGELLGFNHGEKLGSIKNRFKKGDILFGKLRPYLRKFLKAPFDGVCSSEIWVLTGKMVQNDFLYAMVQTETYMDLVNVSSGSKMPRSDWKVVSSGFFNTPEISEQNKIGTVFGAIDEKLNHLKKKKSLLEQYKKGMMQKIFNQEIRFKDDDGKDFGDWEEMKLGEVSEIVSGLSEEQNDQKKGYLVTRIETISNGSIDMNKLGYVETTKDMSTYKLLKGDILFSNINSVSHIGKTAYVNENLDIYHGMNLLRLKVLTTTEPRFLYYFLNRTSIREYMKSICNQAVSQASINQTSLGKTKVLLPSLKEQTKIANFLSSIDAKINLVTEQIDKCEVWKKGLLREMFV